MYYKISYFIYFFFLGLFFNLVPGHFETLGLDGVQRALILGVIPVISFFCHLLWGVLADHGIKRVHMVSVFSLISSIGFLFVFIQNHFLAYFFMSFIMGAFVLPQISLNDSLMISYCHKTQDSYGDYRLWGTISFICANIYIFAASKLMYLLKVDFFYLFYTIPFVLLLNGLFSLKRQEVREQKDKFHLKDIKAIFKQNGLVLFFIIVILHNCAFVSQYSYFSAHLKILGKKESFIALCWAIAPLGEIFVFKYYDRFKNKIKMVPLFRIALFMAALRWFFLTFSDSSQVIFWTQLFHSLSFGGYYMASIYILKKVIPERLRSTGQGIFAACVCLGMVSGNVLFGFMYDFRDTWIVFQIALLISVLSLVVSYFGKMNLIDKDQ